MRPRSARLLGVAMAAPLLAGCADLRDDLAREATRSAVRPVLAQNFPGVPLEPATDCVINAATGPELGRLARAAATQDQGPETAALIAGIVRRPETLRCLATQGVNPFLI